MRVVGKGLDRIDWVGHHLVDADGIHFSAEQLSEVAEFPTPVGAKGLRSFLGLAYYLPSCCIFSKTISMNRSYCALSSIFTSSVLEKLRDFKRLLLFVDINLIASD